MLFKRTEDLKTGMRLARPIYNKNGVLLYERNSKLTLQGINSIRNFGLIGIYVLEPAEPVPPMTKADIEFERFQTMEVFAIREELELIALKRRTSKMPVIVGQIIKNYGNLDKKIHFIQNLRSKEDYMYKHALNVAMLCAIIGHRMKLGLDEQLDMVIAGIVHEVGKPEYELVDTVLRGNPNVKRICAQCCRMLTGAQEGMRTDIKLLPGAKILIVAETYDTMTAMQLEQEPVSEVYVLKFMMENPEIYDPDVVDALIASLYILHPGVSVELNTGEKGVVLVENTENVLRPTVLSFKDNMIIELGNEMIYGDLEIKDIMKTMDNRYIMDLEVLKQQGIKVKDAKEFIDVEETGEYIPGQDF